MGSSIPSTTRTTESSHGTRIVPVVHQPSVGEMRKTFQRIVVGEADGFAAEIARRHHQDRRARFVAGQSEQQRVQRGVGQHHPEIGIVRRDRVGDGASRRRGNSTMGRCVPESSRADASSMSATLRAVLQIGHHDRERLVAAALPVP